MKRTPLEALFQKNAAEITRLNARVHETLRTRDKSAEHRAEWKDACAVFHKRYNELAFPGGWEGALDRISSGDADAVEAAICFLEQRPFFFRSGYMFQSIMRRCKQAQLPPELADRFDAVQSKYAKWKKAKIKRS